MDHINLAEVLKPYSLAFIAKGACRTRNFLSQPQPPQFWNSNSETTQKRPCRRYFRNSSLLNTHTL